jgi:stage II sporulation protein AB (anti-sigma F factor)
MRNEMTLSFPALSENESFARVAVASFVAQLDPTVPEMTEIKTMVSEVVTNAIIHGYEGRPTGMITINVEIDQGLVDIVIRDEGMGIENIEQAREPLYTSKPDMERSGMGFTIMESFADKVEIDSTVGVGTTIRLKKNLQKSKTLCN